VLEFRPFGCRLNRGRDTPAGTSIPADSAAAPAQISSRL
jgi:hypothetical protein